MAVAVVSGWRDGVCCAGGSAGATVVVLMMVGGAVVSGCGGQWRWHVLLAGDQQNGCLWYCHSDGRLS